MFGLSVTQEIFYCVAHDPHKYISSSKVPGSIVTPGNDQIGRDSAECLGQTPRVRTVPTALNHLGILVPRYGTWDLVHIGR